MHAHLPGKAAKRIEVHVHADIPILEGVSKKQLEQALESLGPLCYEAVEVELTLYHDNGEQESRLLFVGPTPHAIHEAQRRCMIEDVSALLARQFGKAEVAEVAVLVNRLFEDDWKTRAAEAKKPERAFETATRPARKHLH